MTIDIILHPLKNVEKINELDKWIVINLPAQLELNTVNGFLATGWFFFKGRLIRRGRDFSAHLIVQSNNNGVQTKILPLPTTLKGKFAELIYLPKETDKLILEPMRSHGEFELYDLSLEPIGFFGKIFKMIYRVGAAFRMQRLEDCRKAGLRFYLPFINLEKAYQIASRFRYYAPALNYPEWLEEFDALSKKDRLSITRQINQWSIKPVFEILIDGKKSSEGLLQNSLESLNKQLYQNYNVALIGEHSNTHLDRSGFGQLLNQRTVKLCQQDDQVPSWVIMLRAGVMLSEHALYWLCVEIQKAPNSCLIYSDHDYIRYDGSRSSPVFKPDWSPELLRSTNYIGDAFAVRSDVIGKVVPKSAIDIQLPDFHNLFLKLSEEINANRIRHIPALLWHLPIVNDDVIQQIRRSEVNPVAAHLKRLGILGIVKETSAGHYRVNYTIPAKSPIISIIIPTRNAVEFLKTCVNSVLEQSSYRNFELIIVDNQSDDAVTLEYLNHISRDARVRVLKYDHPFNYSAINNFAASEAFGEVLCLLNNDTEVIAPDWMEEMLGHLLQRDVGVVGAKLYYSDGRVQHAGDAVGTGGCANHLHAMIDHDDPGYSNRAVLAQDLSAVTAACLMTWRHIYENLGGLDEQNLPVAFNDVDYCLRVREAGYRVVWTPYAELYHHESVSRGRDDTPAKKNRARAESRYMRKRWKHVMQHDPFYNPNLSYQRPDFSLSHAPRVKRPWEKSFWKMD